MNDAKLKSIRLIVSENELSDFGLTPRQAEVARSIADIGSASVKEIMYFTGASASILNTLVKKGVAEFFDLEVYRSPIKKTKAQNTHNIVLTDEQNEAFGRLDRLYSSDKGETALLYGVTGSGKTSVFLKMVDKAVSEGLIVIVGDYSENTEIGGVRDRECTKVYAAFRECVNDCVESAGLVFNEN